VETEFDVGRRVSIEQKSRSLFLSVWLDRRAINVRRTLQEKKRQLRGKRHQVDVFLQLDDPWSYILSCFLPDLQRCYDIDLVLHLSEALGDDYQPAPEMLSEYAINDSRRLAEELGLPFLDKGQLPPTEHRLALSASLAAGVDTESFSEQLLKALAVYWRGDTKAAAAISSENVDLLQLRTVINASQDKLQSLGHYNSAMLHYAGEWYWGIDRLQYLLQRLDDVVAAVANAERTRLNSIRQVMRASLPIRPPAAAKDLPPLELFYSPRSPYSYIALKRIFAIVDAFGLQLQIRPVLPMVMRGLQVPRDKLRYIAFDAVREAHRCDVSFGNASDPVGAGVERFMAVFNYARLERRERDFVLHASVAIWSEAIDLATDSGMRKVTGRTGLFWPDAKAAMDNDDWREGVDANREAMAELGCWGVPTLRMGDFVTWGQDRDWLLVRYIEEHCQSGDGILV